MDRFAHPAMYWVNRLDVGRHRDGVGRHRDGSVSTAMVLKWIACLRLSVGRVRRSPSASRGRRVRRPPSLWEVNVDGG